MTDPSDFAPRHLRAVQQGDHSSLEQAVTEIAQAGVGRSREPTDTEYVANNIDRLRYLDLKKVASDILGTEKRDADMTPATLADLMAEWAAANKTKVQA